MALDKTKRFEQGKAPVGPNRFVPLPEELPQEELQPEDRTKRRKNNPSHPFVKKHGR